MLVAGSLRARQNPDGGWSYRGGSSWTEPSGYALLALVVAGEGASETARRGVDWLVGIQRPDGGWPPRPGVDQATWVTALPLLLPIGLSTVLDRAHALDWLMHVSGRESSLLHRIRMAMLGVHADTDLSQPGWPWFPGTAAWVSPTCLAILALEKAERLSGSTRYRQRLQQGREYLMSHMCADGGWNHGSSRALGYDAGSYPETTGLALLALHSDASARLDRSLRVAETHLADSRSSEATSWLELGLLAHSRTLSHRARGLPPRTTVDLALSLIAEAARHGRNIFVE